MKIPAHEKKQRDASYEKQLLNITKSRLDFYWILLHLLVTYSVFVVLAQSAQNFVFCCCCCCCYSVRFSRVCAGPWARSLVRLLDRLLLCVYCVRDTILHLLNLHTAHTVRSYFICYCCCWLLKYCAFYFILRGVLHTLLLSVTRIRYNQTSEAYNNTAAAAVEREINPKKRGLSGSEFWLTATETVAHCYRSHTHLAINNITTHNIPHNIGSTDWTSPDAVFFSLFSLNFIYRVKVEFFFSPKTF